MRSRNAFVDCKSCLTARLQHLGLPTLEQRRLYFDLLECFKIVHGLVRSDCKSMLAFSTACTRAQNCKLAPALAVPRRNVRKHYFVERVLFQWNALPGDVLPCASFEAFKAVLRVHLHV